MNSNVVSGLTGEAESWETSGYMNEYNRENRVLSDHRVVLQS
jgi:hypothetical protein